jgi:AcrR family transcriptional regulator
MSETSPGDGGQRHEHGWPEKRQAIAGAATTVFVRDGYARATVADIAALASVSKRTLYKHYGDKEQLFVAVVSETIALLRDRFAAAVTRHLSDVTDIDASLISFGCEWVSSFLLSPELIALRRLRTAEAPHFPQLAETWRRFDPESAYQLLAPHLRRLAERGLLAVPDPELCAEHLSALICYTMGNRALYDEAPVSAAEIDTYVRDRVSTFLRIYRPGKAGSTQRRKAAAAHQPAT